jgi:MFS transporter, DHA2 family, multidrug resistance protein
MATSTSALPGATPSAAAAPAMPLRRIFAFLAMVFGMFMAILDIQIVSASLAEIQAGLAASADEISWVQTAYLIAEVIMIPLSGYLSRALSTRVFFTISAIGFTLTSVMCAMSSSISEMIVWRAAQGFIGGGMIPGVFAAAFTIFPPEKRPIVSPVIGLVATLAPTIGPTIGGYLSSAFSWHWLFLINVIPGIGVSIAAWTLIDFDKPDRSLLKAFDWIGLIALACLLGSLEYVLEEGPGKEWYADRSIVVLTMLMVAGGVAFFSRALTRANPLVDLGAFRNRNFALGSLFSFSMGIGLYGLTYLYPVYLGRVRGFSALMIGETMFVTGIAMFLTAPVAGFLSRKLDLRLMLLMGLSGFALGTWIASGLTRDWDFHELLIPQLLRGVSLMMCMVPINNIALGTLPPAQIKGASGLYNLTRNLGGAVGLALINTALNHRTDLHIARLHEAIHLGRASAEEMLAGLAQRYTEFGGAADTMALAQLSRIVHREALVMAFGDVFLILTALFLALAAMVIILRKPAAAASGGGH